MNLHRYLLVALLASFATPAIAQRHSGGGGGGGGHSGGGGGMHASGSSMMSGAHSSGSSMGRQSYGASGGTHSSGSSIGRQSYGAYGGTRSSGSSMSRQTYSAPGSARSSSSSVSRQSYGAYGGTRSSGSSMSRPSAGASKSQSQVVGANHSAPTQSSSYGAGVARTSPGIATRYSSPSTGTSHASSSSVARPSGMLSNRYAPSAASAHPMSSGASHAGSPAVTPGAHTVGIRSGAVAPSHVSNSAHASHASHSSSAWGCASGHHHNSCWFTCFGFGFGYPFFYPGYWCGSSYLWWTWPHSYWAPYYWSSVCEPDIWWWPDGAYQPRYVPYYYSEQVPAPVAPRALTPEEVARDEVAIGDSLFKAGRFAEAAEAYGKAQKAMPGTASIDLLLADALLATGDYHQAAFLINGALRRQPELARATPDKRSAYGDAAVFDAQLAKLQQYLADQPYDAMAQLLLAYNLKLAGKPDEAKVALHRLLEIDPDNSVAKQLLEAH